jgi:hypothetical protein
MRTLLFFMAWLLLSLASATVQAKSAQVVMVGPQAEGQRLSKWLRSTPEMTGLSSVESAHLAYLSRREEALSKSDRDLVEGILMERSLAAALDPAGALRLLQLVRGLPHAGRVVLESSEPEWLEVNPVFDPVLREGDRIVRFSQPRDLVVVLSNGRFCRLAHQPGQLVYGYINACRGDSGWWARLGGGSSHAPVWMTQPNGDVQRIGDRGQRRFQDQGLKPLNVPEAGTWIWAPDAGSGFGDSFSWAFAELLAAQGPAGDYLRPVQAEEIRIDAPALASPVRPTASAWGAVGLIQTPTARMSPDSELTVSVSRTQPYRRTNVFVQALPWMEFGFRYTDIEDQLYSNIPAFSGDQSYKDKSIDAKFRLLQESDTGWWPDLSVGFIDVGGTGLFSSEFLAATKQFGNVDATIGMAWGYLGQTGGMTNPIGSVVDKYKTRQATSNSGRGGQFSQDTWFSGPVGLFGGLQWQTPWQRWTAKLEYESNDYSREPLGRPLRSDSPVNFGLTYAATRWVDLSVSYERGNEVSFVISLHAPLNRKPPAKLLDPKPLALEPSAMTNMVLQHSLEQVDWQTVRTEAEALTQWRIGTLRIVGDTLEVVVTQTSGLYTSDRVDLMSRLLHTKAPSHIRLFVVQLQTRGVEMNRVVVDRAQFAKERSQLVSVREQRLQPAMVSVDPMGSPEINIIQAPETLPGSSWWGDLTGGLGMSYAHHLGGPDGFWLYQIGVSASAEWRPRPDTWVSALGNHRLIDNYERFKITTESALPQVRTLMRRYYTDTRTTIPNLQATHIGQLSIGGGQHFYSVYAGYLEWMFGGAGAEYLWRPWRSPVSVGVDINRVRQREFNQRLDFRDYETTTGHITGYWETGWNDIMVQLKVGQYLAQDKGATLDVSRIWSNGVSFGMYATKTNVSAEQFGEGSFDKGVYLSIPFDALLPKRSTFRGSFVWQPITRDGGAILGRRYPLYGLSGQRAPRAMNFGY